MSKHLLISLFFIACIFTVEAQLVPFPYTIEKEAVADTAMVVSAHPLATKVGLEILKKGGNAIDAAVAVQFALAVVYPQAGNIGGGGFLIYRDAKGKKTLALDYREKAPVVAHQDMYLDSSGNVVSNKSRYGALACGVPGTVDGMWKAHQQYGNLPWGSLLAPAIELADKGFQITERESENLNAEKVNFVRYSSISPALVKFEDWKVGDWLIQKDLAQTLRRIAGEGRDGFYTGATAMLIEREMKKKGGVITSEDLKNYQSVWRIPLEFDWKGGHIITMPPPSSGGILLQQMLGMTSNFPLKSYGFHSVEAVHLMTEVERRAYADRAVHAADPDFWSVPTKELVDSAYLRKRMADFDPKKASKSADIAAGYFKKESEETTHYCIVDKDGNAVSVTTTLNDSYGSRCVVGGAGFILNNEMDDFSIKPGVPNIYGAIGGKANAIAAGKRPLSSMTPTIVTKNGKTWMLLGTPGGTTIPTSVFQALVNVAEFDMPLSDAVQAKRFHHQWKPDHISAEEGCFSEETAQKLEAMGHQIQYRSPIGRLEAIMRLPNGKWLGVADQRGDDAAAGY